MSRPRRYGPTPRLLLTVADLFETEADALCGADARWSMRPISDADVDQAASLRATADQMRMRAVSP